MPRGLNKVMLIGNAGQDPEMKYTPSGVAVATFSMATSESWKDGDGQQQERTEWHSIVAWRKLAEIVGEYVQKGDKVYIEGKLQTRSWDDKNDGKKRYKTEIVADQLIMLGNKDRTAAHSDGSDLTVDEPKAKTKAKDDDLPF